MARVVYFYLYFYGFLFRLNLYSHVLFSFLKLIIAYLVLEELVEDQPN